MGVIVIGSCVRVTVVHFGGGGEPDVGDAVREIFIVIVSHLTSMICIL